MIRRGVAAGIGLGMLLGIGVASTALDIKSRHDVERVNHTLKVLQDTSELRVELRQAEAAGRGYALTGAPTFIDDFRAASARIPAAFAALQAEVSDSPAQVERLRSIDELIQRRIAISGELIRLHTISDQAGIDALNARAEGRAAMAVISQRLDDFVAEEKRQLAARTATSRTTGTLLLAADLAGVMLILLLAAYLIRSTYLSNRALRSSLSRSKAETSSLEARALEQQDHLIAAYENLRHSSEILENTFNSMAEGVLVVEPDGKIVIANEAVAQFLGMRPGKTFNEMKAANQFYESDGITPIADAALPIARTLRGEEFDRKEVVVKPTDGRPQVRLMVSGRPLRNPDGRIGGAAMVYHDITNAHETERLLQQAQKLDAIGKLTGGVAHDFNNMLTIITGSIEALVEQIKDRPATAELAALIGRAADRCTELIRHLLAFARKQPLRPRDIDVNSTVLDIAKLLRPTLGEQIEINSIIEEETLIAHVDSAQLANSLVNLAINARDAMPNGGKLLLETHKAVLDEAYAAANAGVTPGPYIMVAVSDTGTGMPAEVRDRAFEPFFTTKEAGKGSGLGLSMVYGFAKQSGGHVKIYSEEGRGTTVRLYLPPAKASIEADAVPEAPVPLGNENVLVVEDDTLVRQFVVGQLHGLGYTAMAVSNGAEALAAVKAGERVDLLFTDVIMPGGMTGKELADEVKRLRPQARVLYTSGYTDNAMIEHGQLDHGALLLSKPYRRSELARMVREALQVEPVA
ncbi:CHASE3 domain-containing protein [Bradyrhizobium sp. STM 3557]|uniref:CHASE3 domain-containing protein n=1 Tax=Bradyrhizobium sp. STM 3557 TaxID=578920 RepID=UPI00388DB937